MEGEWVTATSETIVERVLFTQQRQGQQHDTKTAPKNKQQREGHTSVLEYSPTIHTTTYLLVEWWSIEKGQS